MRALRKKEVVMVQIFQETAALKPDCFCVALLSGWFRTSAQAWEEAHISIELMCQQFWTQVSN
ncbi:MAG: hypothetical protein AAAB35_18425, partial [Phyllobacterium sp.]|uniref:hypothetical protein n=1 Tax=Phyllobacterium sp. TaxID=1871046 RepID=UPI0030F29DD6